MPDDIRQSVYNLLEQLPKRKLEALKYLFWAELNYNRANEPLSIRNWPQTISEPLAEPPTLFATAGHNDGFQVIYTRLKDEQLLLAPQRPIIGQLLNHHPYALFIFSDLSKTNWHFVNVRYEKLPSPEAGEGLGVGVRRVFRRITIGPYERLRTATERISLLDIATLSPDLFGLSPLVIQQRHDEAFNVEAVTKEFFRTYRAIFEQTEQRITAIKDDTRRLFTQRLFNRLLFIVFLERKGWLTFTEGAKKRYDFLQALWEAHQRERRSGEAVNFYNDRLKILFFAGLNTQNEVNIVGIQPKGFLQTRIGRVPYLNGGLFEEDELDRSAKIRVPDEALAPALAELLYHYNFTVTESTPLDMEVAVDPEMLGKIFEELVTGRHESGSYYTPKPVVAFMGQEALKGYLETACPNESAAAIAAFVEQRDATGLRDPERVLEALKTVKICDPACGSGAYLLGMLHELLDLRGALFTARRLDPLTTYQRKLEIIQNNLYGVDLDPFAVNIARLRLWLSLIVEFEGDNPPPLPNLDFKIEAGDSLTAPDPSGGLQPDMFRQQQVVQYFRLKGEYLEAHGPEKLTLRRDIDKLRAEIAAWAHPKGGAEGFDWAVEFAEVFAGPQLAAATLTGAMAGIVNAVAGQMQLTGSDDKQSGFDIVLANPPYVRQELLGSDHKARLKPIYPEVYTGTADLYVYFYARALQLLKPEGMLVFISSNKFMRAGYGEKLRQLLAQKTTLQIVIDFGDLPLFEATAYPAIVVTRKHNPVKDHALRVLTVDNLAVVDHLPDVVPAQAWAQPQTSLRPDGWTLERPEILALMKKLRGTGKSLNDAVNGKFHRGVLTGFNTAFVIDESTKQRLIEADPHSSEVIKPWVRGRDVRRWHVNWGGMYLIAIPNSGDSDANNPWAKANTEAQAREVFKKVYPAIHSHLSQYEETLRKRLDQGRYWWELRACAYYGAFKQSKIVYPHFNTNVNFAFDEAGSLSNDKTYIIPSSDLYLLGILNSKVSEFLMCQLSPSVQQGYMEFRTIYVGQLPIPISAPTQRTAIEALVRQLLETQGRGPQVAGWEAELNRLVYQVYGLSEAEIRLIEGAVG